MSSLVIINQSTGAKWWLSNKQSSSNLVNIDQNSFNSSQKSFNLLPECLSTKRKESEVLKLLDNEARKDIVYKLSNINWNALFYNEQKLSAEEYKHAIDCLEVHGFGNSFPAVFLMLHYVGMGNDDKYNTKIKLKKVNFRRLGKLISSYEKIGVPYIRFTFEFTNGQKNLCIVGTREYFNSEQGSKDLIEAIDKYVRGSKGELNISIDPHLWNIDDRYRYKIAKAMIDDEVNRMEKLGDKFEEYIKEALRDFKRAL